MPWRFPLLLAACLAAAFPAHAESPPLSDALDAQWEAQQVETVFFAFSSFYTCEGIRSQIRKLIVAFGGRADAVLGGNCAGFDRTPPSHRLKIAFAIPVVAAEGTPAGETFRARWQEVTIEPRKPRNIQPGDCELVEQFAKHVLPLFNPKEISRMPNCNTRGDQFVGEPILRATVLVPLPPEQPEVPQGLLEPAGKRTPPAEGQEEAEEDE
jgi:hypothetical protein